MTTTTTTGATAPPPDARPLRVAVVDDQPLLVSAFSALLEAQPDLEVVARAGDGSAALLELGEAAARGERADVVLMDVRMPVLDGIEATRRLLADPALSGAGTAHPTHVLMLTTFQEEDLVLSSLRSGASGYLLKDTDPTTLLAAVRAVGAGQAWLDPVVTPVVLRHLEEVPAPGTAGLPGGADGAGGAHGAPGSQEALEPPEGTLERLLLPGEALTGREREVLHLVCQGMTNAQIASRLFLAESTVKTHVKAVLRHTGCRNRVELIVRASSTGLVRPAPAS